MSERYAFEQKAAFLSKLETLIDQGVAPSRMTVITPFHVHETEHLLREKPSKLKYFAFGGAMTGMACGICLDHLDRVALAAHHRRKTPYFDSSLCHHRFCFDHLDRFVDNLYRIFAVGQAALSQGDPHP